MPKWEPDENFQRSLLIPFILLSISLLYFIVTVNSFIENIGKTITTINLIASVMLITYISGRFYSEYYSYKDFVELSSEGINFRESPSFSVSWLPINKKLFFEDIDSVDLVEHRHMLNPEEKNLLMVIRIKNFKSYFIGSNLSYKQIMNMGFALKGSVAISSRLKRFLGEEKTVKDVIDTAKGIWSSFMDKKFKENINE